MVITAACFEPYGVWTWKAMPASTRYLTMKIPPVFQTQLRCCLYWRALRLLVLTPWNSFAVALEAVAYDICPGAPPLSLGIRQQPSCLADVRPPTCMCAYTDREGERAGWGEPFVHQRRWEMVTCPFWFRGVSIVNLQRDNFSHGIKDFDKTPCSNAETLRGVSTHT